MNQAKPKRHLKNFLLDPRFQLKYTGMVVFVTVVVAAVLGGLAYNYSTEQTQMLAMTMEESELPPEVEGSLEAYAAAEDAKVLRVIIAGIALMTLMLGMTGIVVTHKLVGPAYKLRRLLREVAGGKLKLVGTLRKGDELQEVFEAFAEMVESLRSQQGKEIAELDAALSRAREQGVGEEALAPIQAVRDRMQAALD